MFYYLSFSKENLRAEFGRLDVHGTGFLSECEIKETIIDTLDDKFQEIIAEWNVADKNVETDEKSSREPSFEPNSLEILPNPPDGGYGWVIVFACFMCNLIISKLFFQIFFDHNFQMKYNVNLYLP